MERDRTSLADAKRALRSHEAQSGRRDVDGRRRINHAVALSNFYATLRAGGVDRSTVEQGTLMGFLAMGKIMRLCQACLEFQRAHGRQRTDAAVRGFVAASEAFTSDENEMLRVLLSESPRPSGSMAEAALAGGDWRDVARGAATAVGRAADAIQTAAGAVGSGIGYVGSSIRWCGENIKLCMALVTVVTLIRMGQFDLLLTIFKFAAQGAAVAARMLWPLVTSWAAAMWQSSGVLLANPMAGASALLGATYVALHPLEVAGAVGSGAWWMTKKAGSSLYDALLGEEEEEQEKHERHEEEMIDHAAAADAHEVVELTLNALKRRLEARGARCALQADRPPTVTLACAVMTSREHARLLREMDAAVRSRKTSKRRRAARRPRGRAGRRRR